MDAVKAGQLEHIFVIGGECAVNACVSLFALLWRLESSMTCWFRLLLLWSHHTASCSLCSRCTSSLANTVLCDRFLLPAAHICLLLLVNNP